MNIEELAKKIYIDKNFKDLQEKIKRAKFAITQYFPENHEDFLLQSESSEIINFRINGSKLIITYAEVNDRRYYCFYLRGRNETYTKYYGPIYNMYDLGEAIIKKEKDEDVPF